MTTITARIPVQLVNSLNLREHWAARSRRAKVQRNAAMQAMHAALHFAAARQVFAAGAVITITRCGGRVMDDDGLIASAKHVRDGVADYLGIDDGDKRLTWVVRQGKAPRGQHWADVVVAGISCRDNLRGGA